jgi:hypothetical protein
LYLVEKADFDKAAFAALQSEEERFKYFEERVDVIKDDPDYASWMLDKVCKGWLYQDDGWYHLFIFGDTILPQP